VTIKIDLNQSIPSITPVLDAVPPIVKSLLTIDTPLRLIALFSLVVATLVYILYPKIHSVSAARIIYAVLILFGATVFLVVGPFSGKAQPKCAAPKSLAPESGTDLTFQPSPCARLLEYDASAPFSRLCGDFRNPVPIKILFSYRDTFGRKFDRSYADPRYGSKLTANIKGSISLPASTGAWVSLTTTPSSCAKLTGAPSISVWMTDIAAF